MTNEKIQCGSGKTLDMQSIAEKKNVSQRTNTGKLENSQVGFLVWIIQRKYVPFSSEILKINIAVGMRAPFEASGGLVGE